MTWFHRAVDHHHGSSRMADQSRQTKLAAAKKKVKLNAFSSGELLFKWLLFSHVHIQTIGILVSEKSELQTALQYTQQAARQKAGGCVLMMFDHGKRSLVSSPFPFNFIVCSGEAEELTSRLQSTKQRVSELERTLSSVSTQQKQFEKLEKERDALRLEIFRQK
uniref:Uncharacterized protein n=1 Tax=Hippocampus comes TaxID=109280 RepID=A0A3Q2XC88_HIPCM